MGIIQLENKFSLTLGKKKYRDDILQGKELNTPNSTSSKRNVARMPGSTHHWRSVEKGVLKHFPNFIGKHLCWSLFLINVGVPF